MHNDEASFPNPLEKFAFSSHLASTCHAYFDSDQATPLHFESSWKKRGAFEEIAIILLVMNNKFTLLSRSLPANNAKYVDFVNQHNMVPETCDFRILVIYTVVIINNTLTFRTT